MGAGASTTAGGAAAATVEAMNLPEDTSAEDKAKINGQLATLNFFVVRARDGLDWLPSAVSLATDRPRASARRTRWTNKVQTERSMASFRAVPKSAKRVWKMPTS